MRLVWATDLHLDHAVGLKALAFSKKLAPYELLMHQLAEKRPDAILLSGDTSTSRRLRHHLARISEIAPVYFVLGNHDYYGGSIRDTRAWARKGRKPPYHWLQAKGPIWLTDTVGLVGVDGWGDARAGNVDGSMVGLSDWELIEELRPRGSDWDAFMSPRERERRKKVLRKLGSDDAAVLRKQLTATVGRSEEVFVVTHAPPWPEASWYNRKRSSPDWLPWFCCVATGEVIREHALANPDQKVTVLCGHTHGAGEAKIQSNIQAYTGGAVYGAPNIQRAFDL